MHTSFCRLSLQSPCLCGLLVHAKSNLIFPVNLSLVNLVLGPARRASEGTGSLGPRQHSLPLTTELGAQDTHNLFSDDHTADLLTAWLDYFICLLWAQTLLSRSCLGILTCVSPTRVSRQDMPDNRRVPLGPCVWGGVLINKGISKRGRIMGSYEKGDTEEDGGGLSLNI